MSKIRLAIIGSRSFTNYSLLKATIYENFDISDIDLIVSGSAPGADSLGELFAKEMDIPTKLFPAKWNDLTHPDARIKINKYGKKYDANAGFRRNKDIVNNSDVVMAFRVNNSPGTTDSINYAKKIGKKVLVFDFSV